MNEQKKLDTYPTSCLNVGLGFLIGGVMVKIETYEELETRAYALALTIIALRDVVTDDCESKDDFITRVRNILSANPADRLPNVELRGCASQQSDLNAGLAAPEIALLRRIFDSFSKNHMLGSRDYYEEGVFDSLKCKLLDA